MTLILSRTFCSPLMHMAISTLSQVTTTREQEAGPGLNLQLLV